MTTTKSPVQETIASSIAMPTARIPALLLQLPSPVRYADAWDLQVRLHHERVVEARPDTILVLQHQPIYTLGRRTQLADWGGDAAASRRNGIEIQHVNRGGSVTYHGPGQLVLYPILRLTSHVRNVPAYVERLEDVAISCLRHHGITGHRKHKAPGVWVADPNEAKIASIGIRVDRGVTMHGLALNVDMDLSPFREITPCGLHGCRTTSMAEALGGPVSIETVTYTLLDQLKNLFAIDWTDASGMIDSNGRATAT